MEKIFKKLDLNLMMICHKINLRLLTIIIRSVFSENGIFYLKIASSKKYCKMLQYQKIDISEEIDINKTSVSKEWI